MPLPLSRIIFIYLATPKLQKILKLSFIKQPARTLRLECVHILEHLIFCFLKPFLGIPPYFYLDLFLFLNNRWSWLPQTQSYAYTSSSLLNLSTPISWFRSLLPKDIPVAYLKPTPCQQTYGIYRKSLALSASSLVSTGAFGTTFP